MEENSFKIWLKNIWPSVYRIINGLFFDFLRIAKGVVKTAINQIKEI